MNSVTSFLLDELRNRRVDPVVLDTPVAVEDIPTPALMIDLDAFEANLARMQTYLAGKGLGLRAHSKMHKCPHIAKQQLAAGAIGICCAKVAEAEVMQAAGVMPILLTSPVASAENIERVARLAAENAELQVVIDDPESASRLNAALTSELGVLIDLDPGMGRTGIEPMEPALGLARHVADHCPNLRFDGLQMYAGNCMHVEGFEARQSKYSHVMKRGAETLALFRDNGFEAKVFSGGGTCTFNMEADLGLMTDLQAGSYLFMDIEYRDIGGATSAVFDDFEQALFVLVTAISKPQERLITVDGRFKSFSSDKMAPQFRDVEGVIFHWGGDEHGIVQLNNPSAEMAIGNKYFMLPPHCDPTVNLHDYYYPVRDGQVTELWPVAGRGCSQ